MQRSRAAERDQRGARGIVAALDRHDAQRLDHRVHRHGDDALGGLLGRADVQALERAPRGVEVEPQVGGDRRRGRQAAEHEVGVGDRGLLAAAAVAGRAGLGARALRPDAQRPAAVDPRDRAAAGADRVDVDHRQAHRQAGDGALHGEVGLAAALGEEERVAARAAHVEAQGGRLADDPRRHRAAGGAGEQHGGRVGGGLLERRDPAGGEHHVRLRQPSRLRGLAQAAEIAARGRAERGIDGRGRRALELAHLGGHLVRGDDERVRQRLAQDLGHARLVRRVAEREQQAHGHGLHPGAREPLRRSRHALVVERPDDVVRPHPLVDLHAQPARHHGRRGRLVQPVQARTGLAAEEEQVAEALGGDQRRACQAPLEQGVGRDRGAVHEVGDVAGRDTGALEHLARSRHHPLLLTRAAQDLRRDHPVRPDEHGVGERAAHVDAERVHASTARAASSPSRTA